jgi:hypothetical protein
VSGNLLDRQFAVGRATFESTLLNIARVYTIGADAQRHRRKIRGATPKLRRKTNVDALNPTVLS